MEPSKLQDIWYEKNRSILICLKIYKTKIIEFDYSIVSASLTNFLKSKAFDNVIDGKEIARKSTIKKMLRPSTLDQKLEADFDSDSDKEVNSDFQIRPSTMGGRINYGEHTKHNDDFVFKQNNPNGVVPTFQSSFLENAHNCMWQEKVRRYKKSLLEREKQLNKAINMIRTHQLSEIFVQEYVQSSELPVPKQEIIELLQHKETIDDKLHLAVLYASPLGYEVPDGLGSKAFKVIQELDFLRDISNITYALEGGKNRVNYSIRMGTPMNFISAVSKNPHVLHFIGHGIKNEAYGKKEDCLVFENEDGSGQLVSSQRLKMILDVWNSKLEVVFLSSWYSESESEVLLNAGAKHVVCIQRNKKVMDEACIKFSSAFYQALFSECKTPCESFNIAQQTLSISQGLEGQSALFIMKTRNSIE
jgi:hypothetical protein